MNYSIYLIVTIAIATSMVVDNFFILFISVYNCFKSNSNLLFVRPSLVKNTMCNVTWYFFVEVNIQVKEFSKGTDCQLLKLLATMTNLKKNVKDENFKLLMTFKTVCLVML